MFNGIPPDAVTTRTVSGHCQMSTVGKNYLVKNYFVLNSLNKYLLTTRSMPGTLYVPGIDEQNRHRPRPHCLAIESRARVRIGSV